MQIEAAPSGGLLHYIVPLAVIVVVVALRARRLSRSRPLKVEWLWIVPALYTLLAASLFISAPPTPLGWLLSGIALLVGAALGWQRGRLVHIEVNPETHEVNQRASVMAILFIIVLIGVRMGARELAAASGSYLHMNAIAITDILIAFAVGLFAVQRIEMFLRARRLLEAARAAA